MTFEQKKQIVIDNSFKVDCNINMTLKEAYEKGFNRGLSKAPNPKVEQSQGEWIIIHNALGETKYQCNQCQHFVNPGDDKNFCPNCGTRMGKIT